MIVSEVYIDESDTHEGTEAIYMAAVVGLQSKWESFDRRWTKLLRRKRAPYIHATEIRGKWGRFKPYKHWTQDDVFDVMRKAEKILKDDTMFTLVIRLDRKTFEEHYKSQSTPMRKLRHDTDYALCFRCILSVVPEYVSRMLQTDQMEMNFILEEHHRFGDAHRVFMEMKKEVPSIASLLGTCIPGEKAKYPGLQGADMQAYRVAFQNPQPGLFIPEDYGPVDPMKPPAFERRAFSFSREDSIIPDKLPSEAPILIAHADQTMMAQMHYGMHGLKAALEADYLERKARHEAKTMTSSENAEE